LPAKIQNTHFTGARLFGRENEQYTVPETTDTYIAARSKLFYHPEKT
jgi:hypothetical protein